MKKLTLVIATAIFAIAMVAFVNGPPTSASPDSGTVVNATELVVSPGQATLDQANIANPINAQPNNVAAQQPNVITATPTSTAPNAIVANEKATSRHGMVAPASGDHRAALITDATVFCANTATASVAPINTKRTMALSGDHRAGVTMNNSMANWANQRT